MSVRRCLIAIVESMPLLNKYKKIYYAIIDRKNLSSQHSLVYRQLQDIFADVVCVVLSAHWGPTAVHKN